MKSDLYNTPKEKPQLLVVDSDMGIRNFLSHYLVEQGFRVSTVADGRAMKTWLAGHSPDLVILDQMLPGEDGLSLAHSLHSNSRVPIIMVSARGEDVDRIIGLEVGADDYLAKPFNPRELLARIRAVMRRSYPEGKCGEKAAAEFVFGPYTFRPEQRSLFREDQEVGISRAEYELLYVLVRHPGRVLSRDFIMESLEGTDHDHFDRSIDVRVTRLRHKIEEDSSHPRFILTVWGSGYQFSPEAVARVEIPATV